MCTLIESVLLGGTSVSSQQDIRRGLDVFGWPEVIEGRDPLQTSPSPPSRSSLERSCWQSVSTTWNTGVQSEGQDGSLSSGFWIKERKWNTRQSLPWLFLLHRSSVLISIFPKIRRETLYQGSEYKSFHYVT